MDFGNLTGLNYVLSDEFQESAERLTRRWDKEWMRYFSLGKDYSFYFYNMDTPNYALSVTPKQIEKFTPVEMMDTTFFKSVVGGVWAFGSDIVGKSVLEMGCGPGIFGRISSRFTERYVGIDVSLFALSIAKLTSPVNCEYIHMYEPAKITQLAKKFDCSFGRNFFIHHNYDDSVWLLKLMRDITKDGGVIIADFFSDVNSLDGERRVDAKSTLSEKHPSSLYNFTDEDIYSIAEVVGITCESIDYVPTKQCRYARLRVGK